jgi:putative membrane protein
LADDALWSIIAGQDNRFPFARFGLQGHAVILSAFFAFLHFFAVFGIVGTIFLEWQTMSRAPSQAEAGRLQRADRWYGFFAVLVLLVGFLRVYFFDKGKAYYFSNPFFQAKLALFLVVGLLSIYPTFRFIRWRQQLRQGLAPAVSEQEYGRIMFALRAELVLILGIVLCASLMARGVTL